MALVPRSVRYGIEIRQLASDCEGVLVGFEEIFDALGAWKQKFSWRIFWIDGVGPIPGGRHITEITDRVQSGGGSIPVEPRELEQLAVPTLQINNCMIGGNVTDPDSFDQNDISEIYKHCEITLECFETTYWHVVCKQRDIIDIYRDKFAGSRIFDPFDRKDNISLT